jgi:hypothetical protein
MGQRRRYPGRDPLGAILPSAVTVEMVRKGCTASYDLFVEFPSPTAEGITAIAQAYSDVGMRADADARVALDRVI